MAHESIINYNFITFWPTVFNPDILGQDPATQKIGPAAR